MAEQSERSGASAPSVDGGSSERYFSVVHRGKAWARITVEDYDEAIKDLQEAKTQLEPDGDNCHVCHDGGHQAWECHHNPLAMAREASHMRHQWRCFHCGAVFTDAKLAAEHFGNDDEAPSACQAALANLLRVIDLADPPDYGYIYDACEAECCGCSIKAATRDTIIHDPDCLQAALEMARAVLPAAVQSPDSPQENTSDAQGGQS